MKKTLKIAVSMALALMMLITPSLAIIAPEDAAPNFSTALNEYFAVRAETLVSPQNRTRSLSNKFSSLEATRAQNFAAVDENIEIVDASAEYAIVNSEINGNVAVLDIYEWSWLEYYADDTVTTTNNMGFGTEHRITLNKIKGEWVIVSDKYDESDVTGVSTLAADETLVLNYDRSLLNEVYAKTIGVEKLVEASNNEMNSGVSIRSVQDEGDTYHANYNPHAAIRYADRWVYEGSVGNVMNTNYYNPQYTYFQGADCINYVSQCLKAGGLLETSAPSYDPYGGWWGTYSSTPEDYESCAMAWRHVKTFRDFWVTELGYTEYSATESTVYPGNPIYIVRDNGKGHAIMCVGYNAAGNTIYNSHNYDWYHATFEHVIGEDPASSYKTIQFVEEGYELIPQTYHNFGTLISANTPASNLVDYNSGDIKFHRFMVNTTGTYTLYSEAPTGYAALDIEGILYKESVVSGGYSKNMAIIADDDNSNGVQFSMTVTLSPGLYYLQTYTHNMADVGYANIIIDRQN